MAQDDKTIDELCRRVAAGVPGAREEFTERMAPLMQLLAKRSIVGKCDSTRPARSEGTGRCGEAAKPLGAAVGDRGVKIASLSDRFCRSLIEKVRRHHRQPGAETCAVRPPWPTERGSAFC